MVYESNSCAKCGCPFSALDQDPFTQDTISTINAQDFRRTTSSIFSALSDFVKSHGAIYLLDNEKKCRRMPWPIASSHLLLTTPPIPTASNATFFTDRFRIKMSQSNFIHSNYDYVDYNTGQPPSTLSTMYVLSYLSAAPDITLCVPSTSPSNQPAREELFQNLDRLCCLPSGESKRVLWFALATFTTANLRDCVASWQRIILQEINEEV